MKKNILVVLALVLSLKAFSQDGPKVVVFNSPQEERTQMNLHNLVKFGMLEPFAGSFTFYYERVLTENFTAEVGLGLTLDNYFNLLISDNLGNLNSGDYVSSVGPVFTLGARYYPELAPEDFYVSPEFRFRGYNSSEKRTVDGVLTTFKTPSSYASGRLTFGYQYFVSKNVFWDFYGGFGITAVNFTTLDSQVITDPSTGMTTTNYSLIEEGGLRPTLHIGIKLGLGFE